MFEDDPGTEAILMMGEIGGSAEEEAAAYVRQHVSNRWRPSLPAAPPRRASGWAMPARSSPAAGTAAEKIAALEAAGIVVAESPPTWARRCKER